MPLRRRHHFPTAVPKSRDIIMYKLDSIVLPNYKIKQRHETSLESDSDIQTVTRPFLYGCGQNTITWKVSKRANAESSYEIISWL